MLFVLEPLCVFSIALTSTVVVLYASFGSPGKSTGACSFIDATISTKMFIWPRDVSVYAGFDRDLYSKKIDILIAKNGS